MKYIKKYEEKDFINKRLIIAIRDFLILYYPDIKIRNFFTSLSSDKINSSVIMSENKKLIFVTFNTERDKDIIDFIDMNLKNNNIKFDTFYYGTQFKFILNKNIIDDIIEMFNNMTKNREFDIILKSKKYNM